MFFRSSGNVFEEPTLQKIHCFIRRHRSNLDAVIGRRSLDGLIARSDQSPFDRMSKFRKSIFITNVKSPAIFRKSELDTDAINHANDWKAYFI